MGFHAQMQDGILCCLDATQTSYPLFRIRSSSSPSPSITLSLYPHRIQRRKVHRYLSSSIPTPSTAYSLILQLYHYQEAFYQVTTHSYIHSICLRSSPTILRFLKTLKTSFLSYLLTIPILALHTHTSIHPLVCYTVERSDNVMLIQTAKRCCAKHASEASCYPSRVAVLAPSPKTAEHRATLCENNVIRQFPLPTPTPVRVRLNISYRLQSVPNTSSIRRKCFHSHSISDSPLSRKPNSSPPSACANQLPDVPFPPLQANVRPWLVVSPVPDTPQSANQIQYFPSVAISPHPSFLQLALHSNT